MENPRESPHTQHQEVHGKALLSQQGSSPAHSVAQPRGTWGLSLLQLLLKVEVCENNVKTSGDKAPSRELAPVLSFLCWLQLCPFKFNRLNFGGDVRNSRCATGAGLGFMEALGALARGETVQVSPRHKKVL